MANWYALEVNGSYFGSVLADYVPSVVEVLLRFGVDIYNQLSVDSGADRLDPFHEFFYRDDNGVMQFDIKNARVYREDDRGINYERI